MKANKIYLALLVSMGLSSVVFASPLVDGSSPASIELAANEAENNDMPPAVEAEAPAEENMDEMSTAELQAEIQTACEELAVDEQIPEENRVAFVEDCVAENMPIEGAGDEMMVEDDQAVMDEEMPAEEAPEEGMPAEEDPALNEDGTPKTE